MAVGAVMLACSPAAEPIVRAPSPPPPDRALDVAAAVVAEPAAEAPVVRRDCLEEVGIFEAPAPAWHLVGTTDEPPYLHAMGPVIFVSTEKRLYDAGPGEPLVASAARGLGLPAKKQVVRMIGAWPDDAWLGTFEGEMTRGSGGSKFHVWRWVGERWVRQTRGVIYGDVAPELYKFTPGRALELRCAEGPGLVTRAYGGDGSVVAPLERAPHSSFCPQVFFATAAGDVFAVDEVRSDPPNVRISERCAGCAEATISSLPVPRMCDQGPTWSVWGLRVPSSAPQELVLAAHTSVVQADGSGQQSGTFLLRRTADAWVPEAVPGGVAGGTIDAMVVAADGALWLVTERLLRRGPDGAWTSVALPEALRGPAVRVDLRGVATLADEVWLLAEVVRDGESMWSVFRTGAPGTALDLDTGRPL